MANTQRKVKAGLAVSVASSLLVCMVTGGAVISAPAGQINFTPQVPTAFSTPIPLPTLLPTVGPGQLYERDDAGRPAVNVIAGDQRFGYGYVTDRPGLMAVWVTNESGTWYLIVEEGSPLIVGQGEQHGFAWYINERANALRDIAASYDDMTTYNDTADDFFVGAMVLGVGGAACFFFTVGLCTVLIGGAIGGAWLMETNQSNAELEQNDLESLRAGLYDLEGQMQAVFERFQALGPVP
jgi:hypothetical protein